MRKISVFVALLVMVTSISYATIPHIINYQGQLTNPAGDPLSGTYSMTFSLYLSDTASSPIWTDTQTVTVTDGIFSVYLNITSLDFDVPYWLGVKVESDSEMTPRQQLTSASYTYRAEASEDLICTGCIDNSMLSTGNYPNITGVGTLDSLSTKELKILENGSTDFFNFTKTADVLFLEYNSSNLIAQFSPSDAILTLFNTEIYSSGGDYYGLKIDYGLIDNSDNGLDLDNYGVYAKTDGNASGASTDFVTNYAIYGKSTGLQGSSGTVENYGVYGYANGGYSNYAIYGLADDSVAVTDASYIGVYGGAIGNLNYKYGVYAEAIGSDNHPKYGVYALGQGSTSTSSGSVYGVYGKAINGDLNYGIYGYASGGTTNWAGYFHGDIKVTGCIDGSFCSDCELKSDIEPLSGDISYLDIILDLEPVSYSLINDETDRKYIGLIAQDLQKVVPEVVAGGENGHLGILNTGLSAILIQAMKEMEEENFALKEDVEKLKKDNEALKVRIEKLEMLLNKMMELTDR